MSLETILSTYTHSLSLSHTHTHNYTHTHYLACTRSLTQTLTHKHTDTHTLSLSLSHTHTFVSFWGWHHQQRQRKERTGCMLMLGVWLLLQWNKHYSRKQTTDWSPCSHQSVEFAGDAASGGDGVSIADGRAFLHTDEWQRHTQLIGAHLAHLQGYMNNENAY